VFIFFAAGARIWTIQAAFVVCSTFMVFRMLQVLWPLAKITSLCQGNSVGKKSILRLSAKFLNRASMSERAQMAHGRFFHYVSTTPTGVELPFIGMVTIQGLVTAGKIAATAAPVFLTFTSKAWASQEGGDFRQCVQACMAGGTPTTVF